MKVRFEFVECDGQIKTSNRTYFGAKKPPSPAAVCLVVFRERYRKDASVSSYNVLSHGDRFSRSKRRTIYSLDASKCQISTCSTRGWAMHSSAAMLF